MDNPTKTWTGRRLFRIAAPILRCLAVCLRPIPRGVLQRLWWIVEWLPGLPGIGLRYIFAKRLCRSCGDNVQIGPGVFVQHWSRLSLGSNVNIHRFCYLDARGGIDIGDDVSIAHACSLIAFDHSWDDASRPIKYNPLIAAPIEIGSDVWLGCGVRILSGVSIGKRSIIAAGAVVTKGIYEAGIFGGVPAKRLSKLTALPAEPEYSEYALS